jgi:hypothetical protein
MNERWDTILSLCWSRRRSYEWLLLIARSIVNKKLMLKIISLALLTMLESES